MKAGFGGVGVGAGGAIFVGRAVAVAEGTPPIIGKYLNDQAAPASKSRTTLSLITHSHTLAWGFRLLFPDSAPVVELPS